MKVFVSHSRENAGAALKLADRLGAHGLAVWLDSRELEGGENWNAEVANAVASCDGFVIVLGPRPTADSYQQFEWSQLVEREYFLDPSKPIVPVVIGSPEMPGFLRMRQAITVPQTGIDFDALATQVAAALGTPESTIDQVEMSRGLEARQQAIRKLKEYSLALDVNDAAQAPFRVLK